MFVAIAKCTPSLFIVTIIIIYLFHPSLVNAVIPVIALPAVQEESAVQAESSADRGSTSRSADSTEAQARAHPNDSYPSAPSPL